MSVQGVSAENALHLLSCRCLESLVGLAECPPCPTCGQPVQSFDDDLLDVTASDGGPAWSGGPWLSIPGTERVVRRMLRSRTLLPCRHELELGVDLTWRQHDAHVAPER